MTVRVRLEAEQDIRDAIQWYESREAGLGQMVIEEIDAAFGRIEAGPERYPLSYRNLRRALVRRFPYAIYFVNDGSRIEIIAVLHQRRDLALIDERD